jgi:hypothetical protein
MLLRLASLVSPPPVESSLPPEQRIFSCKQNEGYYLSDEHRKENSSKPEPKKNIYLKRDYLKNYL